MTRIKLQKRLWICTDCNHRIRDRYEKTSCPNCIDGHMQCILGSSPMNGDHLTLVANGGNYGQLIQCHICHGFGERWKRTCSECNGSGQLHQQWHVERSSCIDPDNRPQESTP